MRPTWCVREREESEVRYRKGSSGVIWVRRWKGFVGMVARTNGRKAPVRRNVSECILSTMCNECSGYNNESDGRKRMCTRSESPN